MKMSDLKNVIQEKFGWKLVSDFTDREMQVMLEAGLSIAGMIERKLPGVNGDNWVRYYLGRAVIHRGGLPQKVVSMANNGADISLVFVNHHVWLYPRLFQSGRPERWFVHELAHVLDNEIRRFGVWIGGGPSDELVEALGGRPKGLRWGNGKALEGSLPMGNLWTFHNHGVAPKYGDNSTADYFAECFTWLIYDETKIPEAALPWMNHWLATTAIP